MNEADTCRVLITPALQQAGWGNPVWRMAQAHAVERVCLPCGQVQRTTFQARSFLQENNQ